MGKLFGTDGVRGVANTELTPELAFKIGRAGAYVLAKENMGKIIVGKDTRKSGDMLEAALIAGINSIGLDVLKLGVMPTPAIAYLTREYKALAGVVISASHNPGEYNGIKFFDKNGLKLPDRVEEEIEAIIEGDEYRLPRPTGEDLGIVEEKIDASEDYINYLMDIMDMDLSGYKIVMDCGHGALYKIGPEIIKRLNGEIIAVNTEPNGMNINDNCGSTNPQIIQDLVVREKADIGISFDGDGDRIIAVDNRGRVIDGDHILAICALCLKKKGELKNNTVVGTLMTNMGLDIFLRENNMDIVKTKVGDRYILEEMLEKDYVLGGEQSGHIIFLQHNTTGDGLATGLYLLKVAEELDRDLADLNELMTDYPQTLINARVSNGAKYSYMENIEVKEKIEEIEKLFKGEGRVVIRPSGTEPLVRVMIEGKNQEEIEKIARELADFIEDKLK